MTILLIGLVLLVIRFLQLGWKVITGEADGFHMADEAKESLELAKELQESDDAGELYSTNKGSK